MKNREFRFPNTIFINIISYEKKDKNRVTAIRLSKRTLLSKTSIVILGHFNVVNRYCRLMYVKTTKFVHNTTPNYRSHYPVLSSVPIVETVFIFLRRLMFVVIFHFESNSETNRSCTKQDSHFIR